MNANDAIDTLGDAEDGIDAVIRGAALDAGQGQMLTEAKKRCAQVQRELIEFNLTEQDAEAERLSDEFFVDAQDGCPND